MSYAERIKTVVDNLDLKKPVFHLTVTRNRIETEEDRWDPDLDEDDVLSFYINRYTRRKYDTVEKTYYVDSSMAIKGLEDEMYRNSIDMFMKTSPNKEPRRTNIYRSFCNMLEENIYKQEFKDSLFNIYEYFWSNTRDKQITHKENSVHRTNIYNLLCLMEKSYGKNRT